MPISDGIGYSLEIQQILSPPYPSNNCKSFICLRKQATIGSSRSSTCGSVSRENNSSNNNNVGDEASTQYMKKAQDQLVVVTEILCSSSLCNERLYVFDDMCLQLSAISTIVHPNALGFVHAFVRSDDLPSPSGFSPLPSLYIVEEGVPGCTVRDYLHSIRATGQASLLTHQRRAIIIYDLLNVLQYLHEQCRIMHGDVKSENVVLDRSTGLCKLSGLPHTYAVDSSANALDATEAAQVSESSRFPRDGNMGAFWKAPEVQRDGWFDMTRMDVVTPSYPADIWALGVLLLEMDAGVSFEAEESSRSEAIVHQAVETANKNYNKNGSHQGGKELDDVALAQQDFMAMCLQEDPLQRASARTLLSHPFITLHGCADLSPLARSRAICGIVDSCCAPHSARTGEGIVINTNLRDFFTRRLFSDQIPPSPESASPAHAPFVWTSSGSSLPLPPRPQNNDDASSAIREGNVSTHENASGNVGGRDFFEAFLRPSAEDAQALVAPQLAKKRGTTSFNNEGIGQSYGPSPDRLRHLMGDLVQQLRGLSDIMPPMLPQKFCEALVEAAVDDVETIAEAHSDARRELPVRESQQRVATTAPAHSHAIQNGVLHFDDVRHVPRSEAEWSRVAFMPNAGQPSLSPSANSYLYNKWLKQQKTRCVDE